MARSAAPVALCTERFTSSGLAAQPAPIMPPSTEPSMKPEESVSTSCGSLIESNSIKLPQDVLTDSSGFIEGSVDGGMIGAGCAASPLDVNRSVQSATGAALRAIKVIHQTVGE